MRVALYARVSTEEQAMHGLSIEAQLAALKEAYPGGEEFVDLGISARKPISKRPELQRLLRLVERDQFDLVVFTKLDRWTRNIREYYKAQDILDAHSVAWRALHEDYETETASGRLKTNIMLAVAQDEADRTSERIKAVFDRKREQGLITTGHVAVGLQIVDGHLVPSADADMVREMFTEYIATRSCAVLSRKYNRSLGGIHYILKNENYVKAGVITPETWQTIQTIRGFREPRDPKYDRAYLFAGLLFCPHCGGRLTVNVSRGIIYYRCLRRTEGRCEGSRVREDRVEEYLLDHLMPAVEDVNVEIRRKLKKKADPSALKKKRDKLADLYLNDLIDRSKYELEYTRITNELTIAEREQKPIDTANIVSVLDVYEQLSRKAKKAFWSSLLRSVTPTPDGFDITLCCI